ncbi:MAG TPA: hypothetical protein VLV83_26635 [Acidobacteriota bacterium]|nr:hypothetical protein [Acidobacteriota bacterium]
MNKLLRLLNPLLAVTFGVGLGKFFWAVIGEPGILIAVHNLTALQFLGALYLTFRVAAQPELGIRHLWLGNHLLFAYCQGLFLLGSLHAPLAGTSLIYFQSESIHYLMGENPPATFQPALRLLNWVVIAPIVVTWISGAPVLLLRRLQLDQDELEDETSSPTSRPEEAKANARSPGDRDEEQALESPSTARDAASSRESKPELEETGDQAERKPSATQGRLFDDE